MQHKDLDEVKFKGKICYVLKVQFKLEEYGKGLSVNLRTLLYSILDGVHKMVNSGSSKWKKLVYETIFH